jgi:phage gp46-like protein
MLNNQIRTVTFLKGLVGAESWWFDDEFAEAMTSALQLLWRNEQFCSLDAFVGQTAADFNASLPVYWSASMQYAALS